MEQPHQTSTADATLPTTHRRCRLALANKPRTVMAYQSYLKMLLADALDQR
jgi:hypothetical protein